MRTALIFLLALLPFTAAAQGRQVTIVPLFPSPAYAGGQGFVRLLNISDPIRTVNVTAEVYDDGGNKLGTHRIRLNGGSGGDLAKHFNTDHVARGVPQGSSDHNWLRMESDAPMLATPHIRSPDGFLAPMGDILVGWEPDGAQDGRLRHSTLTFNPGSNSSQKSMLRILNAHATETMRASVYAWDDHDARSNAVHSVSIPPRQARWLTAADLEQTWGDGSGKWLVQVDTFDGLPFILNLLQSTRTGHLVNLHTATLSALVVAAISSNGGDGGGTQPPSTGHAPATTDEFLQLVGRGRVCVAEQPRDADNCFAFDTEVFRFFDSRFEQEISFSGGLGELGTERGGFQYQRNGANGATIRLTYDNPRPEVDVPERCTASLSFTGERRGRVDADCIAGHVDGYAGHWRYKDGLYAPAHPEDGQVRHGFQSPNKKQALPQKSMLRLPY